VSAVPRSGQRVDRPDPADWPFPTDAFVRASRLVEDGATDDEVRAAVEALEDGGAP